MKCVLHIGTEKTGTSTIQAFLDLNRSLLRSHGILFTQSAGSTNNRGLSVAAYNLSNLDDHVKSMGLRTAEELSIYQTRMLDSLRREIAQSESEGVTCVCFSSEHFHSRLRTEEEVVRLRTILRDLGFREISVVIYLREPAAIVSSLYSTAVLFGSRTTPPPEPKEDEYWDNLCDHRKSLQRFRKVFGAESVKPRLFAKESFVDGSLIADFLHAAGIDLPKEKLRLPERENESISWLGVEVLRRLNMKHPMYLDDGSRNPIRSGLAQWFQSAFRHGRKFRLSSEMTNLYQIAYEDSNEWVRQEYFPDMERLFPSASPETNHALDIADSEIDQFADLLDLLLIAKSQQAASLSGRRLLGTLMAKLLRKMIQPTRRLFKHG